MRKNVRACLLLLVILGPPAAQAQHQPLSSLFRAERAASSLHASSSQAATAQQGNPSGALLIGQGNVAYHSVDVEVDAHGGMHAVYVHYAGGDTGGEMPVYYAYCPPTDVDACGDPDTWQRVAISTNETFVQLELTPEGRPRVMMHHETLATPWGGGNTWYRYAACDQNCAMAAGWEVVDLLTNQNGGAFNSADYVAHSFKLDPEGHPRLIHQQGLGAVASYYVGCDEACTDTTSWWKVRLPIDSFGDGLKRSALAFTPSGEPRILTTVYTGTTTEQLFYLACTGSCTQPSDWTVSEPLVTMGGDGHRSWTLQLDQTGRPRFTLTMAGTTVYAWCDADCDQEAKWAAYALQFGNSPVRYPTLVLDAQDRPRLAYQDQEQGGLGYAWCEDDCESEARRWQYMLAEDDDVLDRELPLLPLSGCRQGAWLSGYRPSLVLDPQGNPRFGHDGEHLMECFRDPEHPEQGTFVEPKWWTSRVVFFSQPGSTGTPDEPEPELPAQVVLEVNHPNPFSAQTTIPFALRKAAHSRLVVYDLLGREAAVLVDGMLPAGEHQVIWDAKGLPAGIYLARLTADGRVQTRPLTLMK